MIKMKPIRSTRYSLLFVVLMSTSAALLLFSCGGGGEGNSAAVSDLAVPVDPVPPVDPALPAYNYHVSSSSGSDTNPGTKDLPLKTISAALAKSKPGDRIGVFSGTYREILQFPRGGSDPSHTISLEAVPGADVRIKGSDAVTGWVPHSGAIWKKTGWNVNSQQVFVDGEPLQQVGANSPFHNQKYGEIDILPIIGIGLSDMAPATFWHDSVAGTLYIWLADGTSPSGHDMEASARDFVIPPDPTVNYIELHGLHFSHSNHTSKGTSKGIVNIWGSSWIVEGNTFTYGDFAGLHLAGANHLIKNNKFNYNGNTGVTLLGSDPAHNFAPYPDQPSQYIQLIENETSYNNYRNFYMHWHAGGIKAVSSFSVNIFRHRSFSNRGHGIWFDILSKKAIIDQCDVEKNLGTGILFEISDEAVISNNTSSENFLQGIFVSASDSVRVSGNLLERNGQGIVVHGMPRPEHASLRNNVVTNNRLKANLQNDLIIFIFLPYTEGNVSDYNLYSTPSGQVALTWTDLTTWKNYISLLSYTEATGFEAHSAVVIE
jgi:hypothetical protein